MIAAVDGWLLDNAYQPAANLMRTVWPAMSAALIVFGVCCAWEAVTEHSLFEFFITSCMPVVWLGLRARRAKLERLMKSMRCQNPERIDAMSIALRTYNQGLFVYYLVRHGDVVDLLSCVAVSVCFGLMATDLPTPRKHRAWSGSGAAFSARP